MSTPISFTIYGEPASKANSRRIVFNGRRPMSIKSQKALSYVETFQKQCPRLDPLLDTDLSITMTIHYASRRPDLDESLILDAMQGFIYLNDRQVKERHTYWALDKDNPRSNITVKNFVNKEELSIDKEAFLWRKVIINNMKDLLNANDKKKLVLVEWYTTKEFKQVCKLASLYYGDVQKVAVDLVSDSTEDQKGILQTFESLIMDQES